jgi:hypothetical protein
MDHRMKNANYMPPKLRVYDALSDTDESSWIGPGDHVKMRVPPDEPPHPDPLVRAQAAAMFQVQNVFPDGMVTFTDGTHSKVEALERWHDELHAEEVYVYKASHGRSFLADRRLVDRLEREAQWRKDEYWPEWEGPPVAKELELLREFEKRVSDALDSLDDPHHPDIICAIKEALDDLRAPKGP